MKYILYDRQGKILRGINYPSSQIQLQIADGRFVMVGEANNSTHRVVFDGFDKDGSPINPRIVDKADNGIELEHKAISGRILSDEQWHGIMDRLKTLEREAKNDKEKRNEMGTLGLDTPAG